MLFLKKLICLKHVLFNTFFCFKNSIETLNNEQRMYLCFQKKKKILIQNRISFRIMIFKQCKPVFKHRTFRYLNLVCNFNMFVSIKKHTF